MKSLFLLGLLGLPGCKGGDEKGEATADTAPYLVDEDALDLPAPSFDAASATAGIETALEASARVTADPLVAAYEAVIADADSSCPTYYRGDDGTYWYDDCTSSTGAHFNGYGTEILYEDYSDGGYVYNGSAVYGVAEITTADGEILSLNGGAATATGEGSEGSTLHQEQISGHFAWTGAEADGTWLEEGLDPQLTRTTLALGVFWGVGLEGSLSGLSGDIDAAVFDGVFLASTEAGSPCEIEPAGTISLRGADGEWVDILFDVPWDPDAQAWGAMDPDTCDGCGAAWSRGVSLGQVCADFSALALD